MCVQNCSRDKGTKGPNTVAKPFEPEPTGNNDIRTRVSCSTFKTH